MVCHELAPATRATARNGSPDSGLALDGGVSIDTSSQHKRPHRFHPSTEIVLVDTPAELQDGSGGDARHFHASSVPIYQTATFKQCSATDMGQFDYSRSGNPTRTHIGMARSVCTETLAGVRKMQMPIIDYRRFTL